jgi:hypothetical protein
LVGGDAGRVHGTAPRVCTPVLRGSDRDCGSAAASLASYVTGHAYDDSCPSRDVRNLSAITEWNPSVLSVSQGRIPVFDERPDGRISIQRVVFPLRCICVQACRGADGPPPRANRHPNTLAVPDVLLWNDDLHCVQTQCSSRPYVDSSERCRFWTSNDVLLLCGHVSVVFASFNLGHSFPYFLEVAHALASLRCVASVDSVPLYGKPESVKVDRQHVFILI